MTRMALPVPVATGLFEGRGGHVLTGGFRIERRGIEHWLVTGHEFHFDGSPEPGFAFAITAPPTAKKAHDNRFLDLPGSGTLTGPQIELRGMREGRIGADFDPHTAQVIFLWCYMTPFLLGVGPIRLDEEPR